VYVNSISRNQSPWSDADECSEKTKPLVASAEWAKRRRHTLTRSSSSSPLIPESANVSRNSRFNHCYILTYSAVQIKKSEMITTAMQDKLTRDELYEFFGRVVRGKSEASMEIFSVWSLTMMILMTSLVTVDLEG
jgi:hypothetical protein